MSAAVRSHRRKARTPATVPLPAALISRAIRLDEPTACIEQLERAALLLRAAADTMERDDGISEVDDSEMRTTARTLTAFAAKAIAKAIGPSTFEWAEDDRGTGCEAFRLLSLSLMLAQSLTAPEPGGMGKVGHPAADSLNVAAELVEKLGNQVQELELRVSEERT